MANRFSRGPRAYFEFKPKTVQELAYAPQYRQQRHDLAQQSINKARENFGQMIMREEDLGRRNELMKQMNENIKSTYQKYDGNLDYALNDITEEISKTRSNPFWGQAEQIYKESEEARQLQDKLRAQGVPVHDLGNARGKSVYDPETGEYRDISYDVKGFEKTYRPFHEEYFNNMKGSFLGDNYNELMQEAEIDPENPGSVKALLRYSQAKGLDISDDIRNAAFKNYLSTSAGKDEVQLTKLRNPNLSDQEAINRVRSGFNQAADEKEYRDVSNRVMQNPMLSLLEKEDEDENDGAFYSSPGASRAIDLLEGDSSNILKLPENRSKSVIKDFKEFNKESGKILENMPKPPEKDQDMLSVVQDITRNSWKPDILDKRSSESSNYSRRSLFALGPAEKMEVRGTAKLRAEEKLLETDKFKPLKNKTPIDIKNNGTEAEKKLLKEFNKESEKWGDYAVDLYNWQDEGGFDALDDLERWSKNSTVATPTIIKPVEASTRSLFKDMAKNIDPNDFSMVRGNEKTRELFNDREFNKENIDENTIGINTEGNLIFDYKFDSDKPPIEVEFKPSRYMENDIVNKMASTMGAKQIIKNRSAMAKVPLNKNLTGDKDNTLVPVRTEGGYGINRNGAKLTYGDLDLGTSINLMGISVEQVNNLSEEKQQQLIDQINNLEDEPVTFEEYSTIAELAERIAKGL